MSTHWNAQARQPHRLQSISFFCADPFYFVAELNSQRRESSSNSRADAVVGKRRVVPASADWTPAINHRLVARSFFSSSALRSGTLALVFGAPVVNPGGREELWVPSRGCVGPSLSPSSS